MKRILTILLLITLANVASGQITFTHECGEIKIQGNPQIDTWYKERGERKLLFTPKNLESKLQAIVDSDSNIGSYNILTKNVGHGYKLFFFVFFDNDDYLIDILYAQSIPKLGDNIYVSVNPTKCIGNPDSEIHFHLKNGIGDIIRATDIKRKLDDMIETESNITLNFDDASKITFNFDVNLINWVEGRGYQMKFGYKDTAPYKGDDGVEFRVDIPNWQYDMFKTTESGLTFYPEKYKICSH